MGANPTWNMPSHGMRIQTLSETLWQLSKVGRIQLEILRGDSTSPQSATPESAQDIRRAIVQAEWQSRKLPADQRSVRIYYSTTASGLADWESYAEPDWNLYAEEKIADLDADSDHLTKIWMITTLSADFGLAYLLLAIRNPYIPYKIAEWTTLAVTDLTDWEPIRGKVFPRASMVSIRIQYLPLEESVPLPNGDGLHEAERDEEYFEVWEQLTRWYRNGVDNHPRNLSVSTDTSIT